MAVAQLGSISAAAGVVHLSQSAVSLQMRRLEDQLGRPLLDRHARGAVLTEAGERLLVHARAVLDANRQAVAAVRGADQPGPIRLGAPHDLLHPHVPSAMRRFAEEHPEREVVLETGSSAALMARFERGDLDLVLTMEFEPGPDARPLAQRRVGWVGAAGSALPRRRPVPLAFTAGCVFRGKALAALETAGISYVMVVDSGDVRAVEAAVAADLGLNAMIAENLPPHLQEIPAEAGLPWLPEVHVALRVATDADPLLARFAHALSASFEAG